MSSAVVRSGQWRIKPSAKLPVFLRFIINSSFTAANARQSKIKHILANRTYLHHMMYWPAAEYDPFETEIIGHLAANDGWFEGYVRRELVRDKYLYRQGLKLKQIDWTKQSNAAMKRVLTDLLKKYRVICCGWYAQYPLDEYFEQTVEQHLRRYFKTDDPDFRKLVLILTDPRAMTEVAAERFALVSMAKRFFARRENLARLSPAATRALARHLDHYAYINRGLATSHPYTMADMVRRLREMKKQVARGQSMDDLIAQSSAKKITQDLRWAMQRIKPDASFRRVIRQAREHSYTRNRRVEAFFQADYGASFLYHEIARRAHFNPNWIMDVSIPEMFNALDGQPLPGRVEMHRRFKGYAMMVRQAETKLITDPREIKKLAQQYSVRVQNTKELTGAVACVGGIIRGRARICMDKKDIGKVRSGDILVAQFTTPDYVPAMEKAAAIVADQGGLSSHAAIVSRELGVPCVIATKIGTRVIKDNDLLEVDATKGIVRIISKR